MDIIQGIAHFPMLFMAVAFCIVFVPYVTYRLVMAIFTGIIDLSRLYTNVKYNRETERIRFYYYFMLFFILDLVVTVGGWASFTIIATYKA